MTILEMTKEEARVLREVLEEKLTALRIEVHRTDHLEYRKMLERRQHVLETVVTDLAKQEGVLTPA